ncbi:MAG TPA: VOC family protein [Bacteroidia bacterium]|nr:VOC family protein [Bacteroidia bacterium]
MNTLGYFEIQSSDPKRDVNFYQTVFGWKFEKQEFAPIEYYQIKTETLSGGLLKRPMKTPPMEFGTNAFTCSFQVADFDATAKKIMDMGGQVAMPKFGVKNQRWQGYFIDLDNNVFGIFELNENAN